VPQSIDCSSYPHLVVYFKVKRFSVSDGSYIACRANSSQTTLLLVSRELLVQFYLLALPFSVYGIHANLQHFKGILNEFI